MYRYVALLIGILLIAATGCVAPETGAGVPLTPVVTQKVPTTLPVQTTFLAVASPTEVPTVLTTAAISPSTAVTAKNTLSEIPESTLKAHIQDAKNKLDQLKNSDKADTVIISIDQGICEIKKSRELGYLIDVNNGEMSFVKGDYGSIALDLFRQNMTSGHTYIILHTHAKDWYTCRGSGIIGMDTFSLADLAVASDLTRQGYHIQKVIAVSDKDYEIYPKIRDNWKTMAEVYQGVDRVEQHLETKFSTYDPYLGQTFYDVDNLMPLLAGELNYTYTINHVVMS
ncbi:MAG: hypothetical protein ACYDDV_01165 [Methanoregula sp.]